MNKNEYLFFVIFILFLNKIFNKDEKSILNLLCTK